MNISSLLPGLKKITSKEWAGPCPVCGGKDRFRVWPDEKKAGGYRWLCRGCNKHGDGIDLYQWQTGKGYIEACKYFNIEPAKLDAWQGKKNISHALYEPFNQVSIKYPGLKWREQAQRFLRDCQINFNIGWDGDACPGIEAVKAIVFNRKIWLRTCLQCGIGYNDTERYVQRSAWGLVPEDKKLRLPKGIVIAIRRKEAGIVNLTIRRNNIDIEKDKGPKYWQVAGGAYGLPYVCGKLGLPVVLVESALDAALVWQFGYGEIASVALMGATKEIDQKTKDFIRQAPIQIIAYDKDQAGREAVKRLKNIFPLAREIPPIDGKDLGEMHCNFVIGSDKGMRLEDWLPAALEIARN